jgi:periplasmic divalent cation tolerance protein
MNGIRGVVILVTCASREEADKISSCLVEKKLAACANIIHGINSIFRWQGKVDSAKESLLIIKSGEDKINSIIREVKSLHSYEVPEIIALPIIGGSKDYLKWLDDSITASP